AFKPNIDDFRESPAVIVSAALARHFGSRVQIVEPFAAALPKEFTDTGATLVELDDALANAELLIVLVDHDVFRSIPLEERVDKIVYDTRGLWPDQPKPGPQRDAGDRFQPLAEVHPERLPYRQPKGRAA
ncbi:MAG: UDP-glucose/GDP-mannose dehydrogenase family protein, partial [Sphingopyxis sp.]